MIDEEKKIKIEINNINTIILDILCTEAIRKIKFILHILNELLKKKKNILHVYITNKIDHLSTHKKQRQIFQSLQNKIELCENESHYNLIQKQIDEYINSLSETNEILCQNSPTDRNIKENRNKIIEDGSLLLNIFRKMKKKKFSSILNELEKFKDEQNLLINLNQNVYHKKQIINILKEEIKEQMENTKRKRINIENKIKEIEKRKKIFFVKFMLYYIYKKEYVHANVAHYNRNMDFKENAVTKSKENMESELKAYDDINDFIKSFLNKRNDNLQNIHDELIEYYEKEKDQKNAQLDNIKKEIEHSREIIELKKKKIIKYDEINKEREKEEKIKMKKEIENKEFLKKYNECILFLQNVGRNKIKAYDEKMKRKKKTKKKKK
ncbi:conserved Plasmodium protein, unknown function [Plasmodium reichenowi]|uniref:Uncharacterized protein n=1 Tax=Plasmodium reichenowi TaxID=5854 RepID=A0A060RZV7_PLARE|nr:conserved Plasmodium protein, unknown function [Plasmodium reichenowi]